MHFWLFLRKNSDFLGQRKLWPVTQLFLVNFNYKYDFSKTNLDIDKLRDFLSTFLRLFRCLCAAWWCSGGGACLQIKFCGFCVAYLKIPFATTSAIEM